ncbi:MAG TPA: hypothetical protein VGM90_12245 [Kofleriaceae bacterium]
MRIRLLLCILLLGSTAFADAPAISAFVTASPFAGFDMAADGHGPSEKRIVELGLGGEVSVRVGTRLRLGIGARFDRGKGDDDTGYFVAVPLTVRYGWSIAQAWEFDLAAGLGPAVAWFSLPIKTFGGEAELGVGIRHRVSSSVALTFDAGIRLEYHPANNSDDVYVGGASLIAGQLPYLRLGATFE